MTVTVNLSVPEPVNSIVEGLRTIGHRVLTTAVIVTVLVMILS